MLTYLRVRNIATISEIEIEFSDGLNILTGETGAGKSILIDSLNFVLGEKASRELIRNGEESAYAEALFTVSEKTADKVAALGIVLDDDFAVLLTRSINQQGKSICKINGSIATVGMMKQVSDLLVDIHGQHEHQSLLSQSSHLPILDAFCGYALSDLSATLQELYAEFKADEKKLNELGGISDREAKIDLLTYQISEIERANIQPDEDRILSERKKLLSNSEKLVTAASDAIDALDGPEADFTAAERIYKASSSIASIVKLDESKTEFAEQIESISAQLEDFVHMLRKYYDSLDHEPGEIDRIESRLDVIYLLKRKYGQTANDILSFVSNAKDKLREIEESGETILRLNKKLEEQTRKILEICEKLSSIRKEHASRIEKGVDDNLHELGMISSSFRLSFSNKEYFSANGYDKLEFLIAPNPGEPEKPLAKIASGGEMSRVMLALKAVLADTDDIETFIFDEIDTGVSGRTAQKVAEKLALIAKKRQILCVTHLPQIAAMCDSHLLIEKSTTEQKTQTLVTKLTREKVTGELARLIGGAVITDATKAAADEMKTFAENYKNNLK